MYFLPTNKSNYRSVHNLRSIERWQKFFFGKEVRNLLLFCPSAKSKTAFWYYASSNYTTSKFRAEFIEVSLNFSETQISAEKVPYKCFIPETKFVPGWVSSWCLVISFHARSIKCFQLGKTDHDFIPVPRTGMKFERVMFNNFTSPWV